MKFSLITVLMMILCNIANCQTARCFERNKGNNYSSKIILTEDSSYTHRIISTDHLFITSYEKGNYQIIGDSIYFKVTEYGVDENNLHEQTESLQREGIIKRNKIILIDSKGKQYEKLKKNGCQQ